MKAWIFALLVICLQVVQIPSAFAKSQKKRPKQVVATEILDWSDALGMVERLGSEKLNPAKIMIQLGTADSCKDAINQAAGESQRLIRETTADRLLVDRKMIQRRRLNPAWKNPVDPEIQRELLRRIGDLGKHVDRLDKISESLAQSSGRCDRGWLRLLGHEFAEIEHATDPAALKRLSDAIYENIRPLPEKPGVERPAWTSGHRII